MGGEITVGLFSTVKTESHYQALVKAVKSGRIAAELAIQQ